MVFQATPLISRTLSAVASLAAAIQPATAFNPSAPPSSSHRSSLPLVAPYRCAPLELAEQSANEQRSRRSGHVPVKTVDFVTVDLEGLEWLHKGEGPPAAAVDNVAKAILGDDAPGVFKLLGHGLSSERLNLLRNEALRFFDRPAEKKHPSAVARMALSRGWEIYPHHYKHHLRGLNSTQPADYETHPEPSAVESILCERFVCGPPAVCSAPRKWNDYYDSDFGQSFFHPNVWPQDDQGALRSVMEPTYDEFYLAAKGVMQCVAAAMGVEHTAFDELISGKSPNHPDAPVRHASRLQLNNYPSQLYRLGSRSKTPLRANQHFDTALLTLLHRQAGDARASGGLEVRLADGSWARVPASTNELTVFLGSLSAILTGFVLRGTTHRVTNPVRLDAANSRRLSIGFNLRPDYSAPAIPPPALRRNSTPLADVPPIGLIGRVGWQRQQIANRGISHNDAVAEYKSWKMTTLGQLRDGAREEKPALAGST